MNKFSWSQVAPGAIVRVNNLKRRMGLVDGMVQMNHNHVNQRGPATTIEKLDPAPPYPPVYVQAQSFDDLSTREGPDIKIDMVGKIVCVSQCLRPNIQSIRTLTVEDSRGHQREVTVFAGAAKQDYQLGDTYVFRHITHGWYTPEPKDDDDEKKKRQSLVQPVEQLNAYGDSMVIKAEGPYLQYRL